MSKKARERKAISFMFRGNEGSLNHGMLGTDDSIFEARTVNQPSQVRYTGKMARNRLPAFHYTYTTRCAWGFTLEISRRSMLFWS
jgi:hypothetical protein